MVSRSFHSFSLFCWFLSIVVYIYSQNNIYSCGLVLGLLFQFHQMHITIRWRDLFYSWLIFSLSLMIFYGLFLHQGTVILFNIPSNIPLISGNIYADSILYGLFLGGSVVLALYVFSLYSLSFFQRQSRFYMPGIWSNLSVLFSFLSNYVSFFLKHRETFQDKLKSRGLSPTAFQKVKLFVHDAAFYSLENSFSQAEALEMRGFSSKEINISTLDIMSVVTFVGLLISLFLFRLFHQGWWLILCIVFICLMISIFKKLKGTSWMAQKYETVFLFQDYLLFLWSILFLSAVLYQSIHIPSYLLEIGWRQFFYFDWRIHVFFIVHYLVAYFVMRKP